MKSIHVLTLAVATVTIMAVCAKATPAASAWTPNASAEVVQVTDLKPFTRLAYIPADADLSSVRIEGAKMVKVATKLRTITNAHDCDRGTEGPSPDCSRTKYESYVPALRVTYSYRGPSPAWDDYRNTYFTFSVYFRPDEIGPGLYRALSEGKINRSAAAELFEISTSRGSVQEDVIDEAKSTLCDGYYADGNWVHTNSRCEDSVTYRKVASPSPYIMVKVDQAPSSMETAMALNRIGKGK